MTTLDFIEALSNANGASGFEDDVIQKVKHYANDFLNIEEDSMRNLVLYRKNHSGKKPIIMLDGHSDEVSFIVQSILPNGMIKFLPLGGWHSQNVPSHKVRIKNKEGVDIEGIIASKPPHFMTQDERKTLLPLDSMTIDVGACSRSEVIEDFKISMGCPIVPDVTFKYNNTNKVMLGKAFDCRLGCAAVVETLRLLDDIDLPFDIVGSISTQEEVGGRGIKVTTSKINPDLAIVFEGTPADDSFRDRESAQGALHKGPQIRLMDRGMISNPRFADFAQNLATSKKIPYQIAVRQGGSTNASFIHTASKAVPCLVLGVPSRYAHTHYSFASYKDFNSTVALALEVINNMSLENYKTL